MSDLGGFAIVSVLGVMVGALIPLPTAPIQEHRVDPRRSPMVIRTIHNACPDLLPAQQEALDRAWAAQAEAQARLDAAQQELRSFIGEPRRFDELPVALQPDAIDDKIERLLDPEVAELQWVDCSEPPCIAVLRLVGEDHQELEGMLAAATPLQEGFEVDQGFEWVGIRSGEAFLTVPLGQSDDPAANHRIDMREETILAELNQ